MLLFMLAVGTAYGALISWIYSIFILERAFSAGSDVSPPQKQVCRHSLEGKEAQHNLLTQMYEQVKDRYLQGLGCPEELGKCPPGIHRDALPERVCMRPGVQAPDLWSPLTVVNRLFPCSREL